MEIENITFWGKWVGAPLSTQVHAAYGYRHVPGAEEFARYVWAVHGQADVLALLGTVSANRTVFNAGIQDEYDWFYLQRPVLATLPQQPPRAVPGTGPEDAANAGLPPSPPATAPPAVVIAATTALPSPSAPATTSPTDHGIGIAVARVIALVVAMVLVGWAAATLVKRR